MDRHHRELDRARLAVLGREWLLHGHLQDRVGMPMVLERAGREVMLQVAIDEWAAASPVYSRRMQQALRFAPGSVTTIFKNLQLDVGAPHQFMDFRYRLDDPDHGQFHLAHCGALMDVEPMGEDFVVGMCHSIEDPTFDATAAASHPQAQMRPVHRPPRVPAGRTPHCQWSVDVVADAEPVGPTPLEREVLTSALARMPVVQPGPADDGGWDDYSGDFDPDFCLEDLSQGALLVAMDEFALQSHLLLRAYCLAIREHFDPATVTEVLPRVVRGWCGQTSRRVTAALVIDESVHGLATLLAAHPMLAPRSYTGARVEEYDDHVRLSFGACPAAQDDDGLTWWGTDAMEGVLAAVVQGAAPHAVLERVDPTGEEVHAFGIDVDPAREPAPPCPELALAQFSTGASFVFRPRRPVRV